MQALQTLSFRAADDDDECKQLPLFEGVPYTWRLNNRSKGSGKLESIQDKSLMLRNRDDQLEEVKLADIDEFSEIPEITTALFQRVHFNRTTTRKMVEQQLTYTSKAPFNFTNMRLDGKLTFEGTVYDVFKCTWTAYSAGSGLREIELQIGLCSDKLVVYMNAPDNAKSVSHVLRDRFGGLVLALVRKFQ